MVLVRNVVRVRLILMLNVAKINQTNLLAHVVVKPLVLIMSAILNALYKDLVVTFIQTQHAKILVAAKMEDRGDYHNVIVQGQWAKKITQDGE
jgi:hypothetical protein